VLAGLVLSLGMLCVRGASSSNGWQYLFWRALGFTFVLTLVALYRHGSSPLTQIKRLGGFAWVSVLAMVASQVCFILAIQSGNTAEVFFLMSLGPLIAAMLARPLLGERLGTMSMFAIAIALGGVALMSGLGLSSQGDEVKPWASNWAAWMLALGTAFAFAVYMLATRGARSHDLDAALVAVGILTALVSLIVLIGLGLPLAASLHDTLLAMLHGGVLLATGLVLFARGSRAVPGVTLVMLAQAETVAAPLWTYLVFNETAALAVIAGGALILIAVVMQAVDGARPARP
jgi:drug/metabolite transporter (DMT)-like permease